MSSEKKKFFIIQVILILVSLFIMVAFGVEEKRIFFIFKYEKYTTQFFASVAFIVASIYMLLLTYWYNNEDNSFRWRLSLELLFISGTLSVLFSFILYRILTPILMMDPTLKLLTSAGADAGLVEEAGKLLAVLALPTVRRFIRDGRTGLYAATLCALGFAFIENISYFTRFELVIYTRFNPSHAVFSSIWGYALGRLYAGEIRLSDFAKYMALGMLLHASWNYLVSFHRLAFWILYILVSVYGLVYIKRRLSESPRTAAAN